MSQDDITSLYTTGRMTANTTGAILSVVKKGQQVRKGKAMLQIHTDRMKNANRQFDLQGTIMPNAKEAEWLICVCLHKTGSSGCVGPGLPTGHGMTR